MSNPLSESFIFVDRGLVTQSFTLPSLDLGLDNRDFRMHNSQKILAVQGDREHVFIVDTWTKT